MRRLIAWLYAVAFGLQVKTHTQHIADLELLLEDLHIDAQRIDADIEIVTRELLKAYTINDAFALRRHEHVDTMITDRRTSGAH